MLTNEVAPLRLGNAGFALGLVVHVFVRLADDALGRVVAECDALEHVLDPEQLQHPARMVDVGVREAPQPDLAPVKVLEQPPQLRLGREHALERQGVVDLLVVLDRVDLVVPHEPFDREPVLLVVGLM